MEFLRVGFQSSERRACQVIPIARSSQRYRSQATDQTALRRCLRDLALSRVRSGYRRLQVLLEREGWHVNHKRVSRLYRLAGLSLRLKTCKKQGSGRRGPKPVATTPNECWSMDVMTDRLVDGRPFRVLTFVDNVSRVSPVIVADRSLTGERAAARAPLDRQRAGVHLKGARRLGARHQRAPRFLTTGQTDG